MIRFITLFILISLTLSQNTEFIRTPSLSPNADKITFSYAGDIWVAESTGGNAIRLTAHEGYESYPMWAPDGSRIAFTSTRFGNEDIFSMKSDGTDVKRHTYHSSGDRLLAWKNSKTLLFAARRTQSYHWMPEIYSVSVSSETPSRYLEVNAIGGFMTATGELFYTTGYDHKWRKKYRGSANNDIFSYDGKLFKQHTTFKGNDLYPMVRNNILYYISEEKSGVFNLVSKSINSNDISVLTNFKDEGIRFASLSSDGSKIILAQGLNTYLFDTSSKSLNKVNIRTPDDIHGKDLVFKTFSSGASEMVLSPDGKQIAIVYKGEIYVYKPTEKKNGRIKRITNSLGNDHSVVWGKESKSIYFLSDRSGQMDIYQVQPKDSAKPFYLNRYFTVTQLTQSIDDESDLSINPDRTVLSFVRSRGDFYTYHIPTKREKNLVKGWAFDGYSWSPDGKYIAYSKPNNNFNNDIYIIPSRGGKSINISQHPDGDYGPIWSPDGKKLGFSSKRFGNSYDVMYVYLSEKDAFKTKDDWQIEEELADLKKGDKKSKDKKKKSNTITVNIDFKNIHKRIKRLTNSSGNEFLSLISKDGKSFFYTSTLNSKTDLYVKHEWEDKEEAITKGNSRPSSIQFDEKQKKIFYKNNSGIVFSVTQKGAGKDEFKYKGKYYGSNSDMRMQVFHDVWRFQKQNFYDIEMHGADWRKLRTVYSSYVKATRTEEDFSDVMNMLLGELNSSHQGYRKSGKSDEIYGNLGGQFQTVRQGLKITSFFKHSPLDLASKEIRIGDIITEINNQPFTNVYEPLLHSVNDQIDLTILRKGKEFNTIVRPTSSGKIRDLSYENWVENNREVISKATKNKLGYIHIRGMNIPSLEQFEMELFSEAEGKDALVIDVRFNGGGWTTDFLLNILMTPDHAFTVPRGGGIGYPQDRRTFYQWSKPIIVLCNEYSYSNAEIFSHAIKTLKRGVVIGNQTFGAVISTSGKTLLNGGWVRMPFRGWFNKGSNINQEKVGAIPHHLIIPKQNERILKKDSQLMKAIEVFKAGL